MKEKPLVLKGETVNVEYEFDALTNRKGYLWRAFTGEAMPLTLRDGVWVADDGMMSLIDPDAYQKLLQNL